MFRHCLLAAVGLFSCSVLPAAAPSFDVQPAERVLQRLLPGHAAEFELAAIGSEDGHERFRIFRAGNHIKVAGSTSSALLFGVNWYLKYVARVQVSPNGDQIPAHRFPLPVQNALSAAHPNARWMMMAWQGNPRGDLLAGVDRERLLIIDIDHDREPRDHRYADFQGAPFLFGGIWEFGGRTTLGANIGNITGGYSRRSKPRLRRGIGTNRVRWQTYFESLDEQLRTGSAAAPIDWFALGDQWNRGAQHYSSEPHGDARLVATRIARELELR